MADTNLAGRTRCDEADQAQMRVVAVLDLASLHGTEGFERPDGELEEFLEDLADDRYPVHPSVEPLRNIARRTEDDPGELGYLLYHGNLLGLVVKVRTPVMTKLSKSSWSFSWGYTQSTWVYAESYDEAWRLGIAWAEQCRENAKAAPKAKKRVPPAKATGVPHA
jgi:hypothetical protein